MPDNGYTLDRRQFIKNVSNQLASDNIRLRYNNPSVYGKLRDKFTQYRMQPKVFDSINNNNSATPKNSNA